MSKNKGNNPAVAKAPVVQNTAPAAPEATVAPLNTDSNLPANPVVDGGHPQFFAADGGDTPAPLVGEVLAPAPVIETPAPDAPDAGLVQHEHAGNSGVSVASLIPSTTSDAGITVTSLIANPMSEYGIEGYGSFELSQDQLRDEAFMKSVNHGVKIGILERK